MRKLIFVICVSLVSILFISTISMAASWSVATARGMKNIDEVNEIIDVSNSNFPPDTVYCNNIKWPVKFTGLMTVVLSPDRDKLLLYYDTEESNAHFKLYRNGQGTMTGRDGTFVVLFSKSRQLKVIGYCTFGGAYRSAKWLDNNRIYVDVPNRIDPKWSTVHGEIKIE